ncbi:hypothetical protein A2Z00_01885 [Candidatus Gottesmanbacteria bacterium RBG_13_45_10]|uniref:Nucleoside 2-deoxyribosyltransferase n=1 Tax=Candidatus Gottesmanbacteria bacterium RBG_13_45_10 TaxID=1798370 RepID=A0A1F5ZH04_9BACT|nr:MAG: hypothetical protein A2Z00_01885 [Candidatus Gottesmanbacteria bacterium RBG_13_45_10]
MNVYFTASIVGKKEFLSNYLKILNILKTKGYEVQASHIIDRSESQINLETRENRLKFHRQLEKWIQSADFMVVESSFPSISVGYEISLGLQYRKPVLILYSIGDPPSLFAHHNDEKVVCEKYTLESAQQIITDFINYVHGASDTRFTFFITSQIAAYLEKVSIKEKIPKSVYLRKLIERHIKENPV